MIRGVAGNDSQYSNQLTPDLGLWPHTTRPLKRTWFQMIFCSLLFLIGRRGSTPSLLVHPLMLQHLSSPTPILLEECGKSGDFPVQSVPAIGWGGFRTQLPGLKSSRWLDIVPCLQQEGAQVRCVLSTGIQTFSGAIIRHWVIEEGHSPPDLCTLWEAYLLIVKAHCTEMRM